MANHYIAIWSEHAPDRIPPTSGLVLRHTWHGAGDAASLVLYASENTPVRRIGQDGVVIGHLFDHYGTQLGNREAFPAPGDTKAPFRHLLADWWGDYVAMRYCPFDGGLEVLSSPSCSSTLPCIYSYRNGQAFVTSSLGLAERLGLLRREIDWNYVAQFLAYPFLKTERSPLVDVAELLPGMLARFTREGVSTAALWTPWDFVAPDRRYTDISQAAHAIRSAVSTAVRGFAAIDKAVLLELSGGLDSSVVGICLPDSCEKIVCSTLLPPLPGADETAYASRIADALQTELRRVLLPVESAGFSFRDASDPIRPGVGPLQFAIDSVMDADALAAGVNGAFSGGGGDTVFCYLRTSAPAVDALRVHGLFAGLRVAQDLALLHQCSLWRALGLTVRKHLRSPGPPHRPDHTFLLPNATKAGMLLEHPWHNAPADALPGDRERIFELAGSQIFMDYLPRRSRRPLRMPLLSQPVMEACLRAPSWMWISGGQNRAVARVAFADVLPSDILSRRSKGTFMSYLGEVYDRNKHSMLDFLLSGNLRARGLLDPAALEGFVRSRLPPRDRTFTRVLDLCRVENWTRQQE